MEKTSKASLNSKESFQRSQEDIPRDQDMETIKKVGSHTEYTNEEGKSRSSEEILKERIIIEKQKEAKRSLEIENLTGHIKFLYGMLNNVMFTLNQHAVVINKELLPAKDKYMETKVMVKMFENILSGTESVKLFNILTQNEDISIFRSSEAKQSSNWSKGNDPSNSKQVSMKDDSADKVEQNITSNANNVVGTSMGLSSGNPSKQNDSSSGKNRYTGSMFNSGHSKSNSNQNILRSRVSTDAKN